METLEEDEDMQESDATSVGNTVKDLHMELIFMYHRVCLKLAALGPGNTNISIVHTGKISKHFPVIVCQVPS